MDPGLVLTDDDGSKLMSAPFQAACSSILWAAIISRLDAQFSVGVLAQHTLTPSKTHWKALKRVIWYLDTTCDLWLTFGGTDDLIRGLTDSDLGSQHDRHSISGYTFLAGAGLITWRSKKQSIVALCTTEAEYIAMMDAIKEALWACHLLQEILPDSSTFVPVYCYNQSAITLGKDNKFHQ